MSGFFKEKLNLISFLFLVSHGRASCDVSWGHQEFTEELQLENTFLQKKWMMKRNPEES